MVQDKGKGEGTHVHLNKAARIRWSYPYFGWTKTMPAALTTLPLCKKVGLFPMLVGMDVRRVCSQ